MSQDIKHIREQLKSCEEVDSPYDIRIGQHVKYITLENDSEFFYEGGIYTKMGNNNILLKNGSKNTYVKLNFYKDNGYILYKTRLFIEKEEEKECEGKKKEEYEKIIHTQQQIIEKMNLQMKKQELLIQKLTKK
tara:strand:- start:13441 stop:13842 length:402 start_codon:yes stop_codon:yes gene_type:complete